MDIKNINIYFNMAEVSDELTSYQSNPNEILVLLIGNNLTFDPNGSTKTTL